MTPRIVAFLTKLNMKQDTATDLPLASKPFSHNDPRYDVKFNIDRCDLDGTLTITASKNVTEEELLHATCWMMTWHAINICPELQDQRSSYIKKVKVVRVD